MHVSECIHACIFLFLGTWCFLFCFVLWVFFSPLSEGAGDMKVCRCSDREGRDRASLEKESEREVGRSQEELSSSSSSNRQRAKRMTVPSSSLSVNMIIFEPSWRSKACQTTCKMVTKGSQTDTQWGLHGKAEAEPSQLCIHSLKIQQ